MTGNNHCIAAEVCVRECPLLNEVKANGLDPRQVTQVVGTAALGSFVACRTGPESASPLDKNSKPIEDTRCAHPNEGVRTALRTAAAIAAIAKGSKVPVRNTV